MRRRVAFAAALLVLLSALLYRWPVGGVIWHAGQVERLALVTGEGRYETTSRPAIAEALGGARLDRFRLLLRPLTGQRCGPRDLAFRTASGWVDLRVHCPGDLFLDYLPWPGLGR